MIYVMTTYYREHPHEQLRALCTVNVFTPRENYVDDAVSQSVSEVDRMRLPVDYLVFGLI